MTAKTSIQEHKNQSNIGLLFIHTSSVMLVEQGCMFIQLLVQKGHTIHNSFNSGGGNPKQK